jgi:16S rRNA (guanine527-N7)-methyltransferase
MNDHAGSGLPTAGASRGSQDRRRAPLPTRVDELPVLPDEYDRALDAGLLELGLTLDPSRRAALATQARLLLAWNAAINLTSITDPALVAVRHVLDSLSAVPLLAARGAGLRICDIGSGAGYPGLPLAIALPDSQVVLVESTTKKARFLEAAVEAAGLSARVDVVAARAEAVAADVRRGSVEPFDVVTARAVGDLAELVELAFPLLRTGGALVAWKRGDIAAEVAVAARAIEMLGGGSRAGHAVAAAGLEGHLLVVVEKRRPTPEGFPRDPARRRW